MLSPQIMKLEKENIGEILQDYHRKKMASVKMAQWITVSATKPNNLSCFRAYMLYMVEKMPPTLHKEGE